MHLSKYATNFFNRSDRSRIAAAAPFRVAIRIVSMGIPRSAGLKTFRYMVPLVTFPMGAGTEAYAAHRVWMKTKNTPLFFTLTAVMLVNVIGGLIWYPSMIRKVGKSRRAEKHEEYGKDL